MRVLLAVVAVIGLAGADPARFKRGLGGIFSGESEYVDPTANDNCVCVPFYQCEDGSVPSYAQVVKIRFGPKSKCNNFNMCCNVHPDVIKKVEAKPGIRKGVLNTISDGVRDIFSGAGTAIGLTPGSSTQCACVAFYQCDGGVLAPEVAKKVDRRQISSTGRCSNSDEKCCTLPSSSTQSTTTLKKCTCVERGYCDQKDIQPLRAGTNQPSCRSSEVCCTDPSARPAATSGVAATVPDGPRPDYDVWKFCKNYPLSVACVRSRQLNARPTLREQPRFDADEDARKLASAIGYFDADDDVLIEILTKRTFSQRALISQAYERLTGADEDGENKLLNKISGTTRGHFDDLMRELLKSPSYYEYLAKSLHEGLDGAGTDEDVVLETLITSTDDEIDILKSLYPKFENTTLYGDIKSDLSGDLEDILLALVNGTRDKSFKVSKDRARDQAVALYQAGEAGITGLGTDEATFKYYLTHESFPQLALIFSEYEQLSGKSFTEALEDEFSRHMEDAVLAIVEVTRNLPRYFALRLHDALWGRGLLSKDDSSLMRIIVSRAEIDLGTIMQEYKAKYGRTLTNDIELKSTGDYEDALVSLCGGEEEDEDDD